jgi:hypothetical protein
MFVIDNYFFRNSFMEIHKYKGLQVILKMRGRAGCSEVKKAISCAPTCLLILYQLRLDLISPRV